MKVFVALLVVALSFFAVESALVQHVIVLDYVKACPDSVCRLVIGCNGTFPCPTIYLTLGDTLALTFVNTIGEPTSVHFHGIVQQDSVEMDGAAMLTQCEIPNGAQYTYTFTPSHSGTYWYHSHSGMQYGDGLKGSLVIFNPENPFVYQSQAVIELSDWYHESTATLLPPFLNSATGFEPVPDSVLINSVGQYKCTTCSYSLLEVAQGTTIRLRLVNQALMGIIAFSIDGFPLEVIEVDGVEVVPKTYDVVRLNVGQRYSVLVNTDKPAGVYYMRAQMDPTVFASPPTVQLALGEFVVFSSTASSQPVVSAPVINPSILSSSDVLPSINNLNPTNFFIESPTLLAPLKPLPIPEATATYPIELTFAPSLTGANMGIMNGLHLQLPSVPVLDYVRSNTPIPYYVNSRTFNYGDVVDIILFNNDGGEHPIHMHGHFFWVLGMGNVDEGPYQGQPLETINPILRDTASVNTNSWLYMRVQLKNPGVWAFHCHIEWHLANGLFVVFVTAPEMVRERLGTLPALPTTCSI